MSKGRVSGIIPLMRFRRGIPLVLTALFAAACATAPPPSSTPPSMVQQEAASYQSPADASRILQSLDERLASGESDTLQLSTPDLTLYSNLLLAAGRYPEAEQTLLVLQTRGPDKEGLWALTLLAGARGDTATQEKRLSDFEKTWPADVDAAVLRARLLLARGDKAGAKAAWTKVLVQQENAEALSGLARLALDAKKPQEALGLANRAVKADPQDDQVWALRARIHGELEHYLPAKSDLDQAVNLAPDDPWHRLDRGKLAFLHLYNFEAARADLEFSTIKNPGNFFGWEALAEVYEELDRPRQAWDAWLKALALRPDYKYAYPSAAMLAFRYQDFARAALYAREAAKSYPGEYAFVFVEALALRAQGQLPASQVVLNKARPRFAKGSSVDELFRFLLSPGSDYYLNTALNLEKKENVRLRLRFYQGCYYALTKAPASAKAAFEEVGESTLTKIPEIAAARDWLQNGL